MSVHLDSDNTFGAAYIGMVVAAVLYGVSCIQAFYYYTTQNDSWYTKLMLTAVIIFDTVHQALIVHIVYTYTITDWGDPVQLALMTWSVVGQVVFGGVTAFIVQSCLTMRIWRLSRRNIYLTGIPAILVVGGFVAILVFVAKAFQFKRLSELVKIKGISISIILLNALTDLLIAGTLCTLLNISRTGFHKSEVIIKKLIVFTVNTGLLTSLCALGCLISILVADNAFIYIVFFFCLGRLYTNTLLATFNAREIIRGDNEAGTAFSSRDFHTNGSNQTQNLSIKIDTTTQTRLEEQHAETSLA